MGLLWLRSKGAALAAGLLACSLVAGAASTGAAPFDGTRAQFADPGFEQAWARTDHEAVRGGRTWYWGPGPWFDYAEFYRQGQNGLRTVQYFDKARMELNNPADRSGASLGVTNGLLVKELVSGRVQLANDPFDYDQRPPADVPVAGNPRASNGASPGYSSFRRISASSSLPGRTRRRPPGRQMATFWLTPATTMATTRSTPSPSVAAPSSSSLSTRHRIAGRSGRSRLTR